MKKINFPILLLITILSLLVVVLLGVKIAAYLTDYKEFDDSSTIGKVDLEIKPYFINSNDEKEYIELNSAADKVVHINISDYANNSHFNKFGVDIIVYSNVETYFRIAVYEQFALTYTSGDKTNVIATTRENFLPFNYYIVSSETESFYDNRISDGYFYYKTKVKNEGEGELIEFIKPNKTPYPLYEERYSVLFGFALEAVQAHLGPNYNWGIDNPPWDSNLSWW